MTDAGQLPAVLGQVTEEVLESMFFTCVVGAAEPPPGEPLLRAALGFRDGSWQGQCGLWISPAAATSMAASFLGLEPEEIETAHVAQVMCELTNMLGGAALSQVFKDSELALSTPEFLGETQGPVEPSEISASFQLDEGFLTVSLVMGPPEPQ